MYICKNCGHKKTDVEVMNVVEGNGIKINGLYIGVKTCPRCNGKDTYVYINELEKRAIKYKKNIGLIK